VAKRRLPLAESQGNLNSLGEALARAGVSLPTPSGDPPEGRPSAEVPAQGPKGAVLSLRRKGLKGHVGTCVSLRGLSEDQVQELCRDLKRSLGCGARVEEGEILIQGDHRERLREMLSRRGFRVSGG